MNEKHEKDGKQDLTNEKNINLGRKLSGEEV